MQNYSQKKYLNNCSACPRFCSVDRSVAKGFCGQSDKLTLALASLHFGEEPPLVGQGGSGTLFFSGCQLACPFCQNYQISRGSVGRTVSVDELVFIMLRLQSAGAVNINIVSGTPHLQAIITVLKQAKAEGLRIPVVYNTGGYESLESLKLLHDYIDVYLPDLKTMDNELATTLYQAKDYVSCATEAILAMSREKSLQWEGPVLKQGVIMRHLILPDQLEDSYNVLKWYKNHLEGRVLLSLLTQYTPVHIPGERRHIPERMLLPAEEARVIDMLEELNLEEGFFQDLIPSVDWLPDFSKNEPFQSDLAKTIWHA